MVRVNGGQNPMSTTYCNFAIALKITRMMGLKDGGKPTWSGQGGTESSSSSRQIVVAARTDLV